jgi:hypothetical protein
MESRNWVWENGILKEKEIEAWKNQIRMARQRSLDETKIKVFESFLKKL